MAKKQSKSKQPIWKTILILVGFIALPLIVGGLSAAITGDAMSKFGQFNKPPLAPPSWLFPVAWSILYVLMGIASFLIWSAKTSKKADEKEKKTLLTIYGIQLFFNFCWSLLFFLAEQYYFAFAWLIVMWVMIIILTVKSRKFSMTAMWMLIPYILWTTFAAYLNLAIAILN